MLEELVQTLIECSPNERVSFAKMGTPKVTGALIYIANGVKSYHPRNWRHAWQRQPAEFYELGDQLNAIDALGETGSRRSLRYLNRLLEYNTEPTDSEVDTSRGQIIGYKRSSKIIFPNANGPLREALNFTLYISSDRRGKYTDNWNEQTTYRKIEGAKEKLERTIKTSK